MKLTDYSTLQTNEQRLINAIIGTLNWGTVREAIKRQFGIDVLTDITADGGEVVICDHQIAYQIHLGHPTGISLFISRSGELIKISASENPDFIRDKLSASAPDLAEDASMSEDASVIASELSDMISRINEADNRLKTEG